MFWWVDLHKGITEFRRAGGGRNRENGMSGNGVIMIEGIIAT